MSELTIGVTIDGETYTQAQLAQFQYQRALHVLHELKRLGATLYDGDHELSDIDINWLEPARAEQISLDYRIGLGEQSTLDLFKDVLADTDQRWKEFNADYVDGDLRTGQVDLEVTGITVQEALGAIGGGTSESQLAIMPEHYIVAGDVHTGQRGMETFGMFGEPTAIHGTAAKEIPASFPFTRDPDYPILIFGETLLRSDDTPTHLGACHQAKPGPDGFAMKSIFFCPKTVPQAMADGHKIHFAIELSNAFKAARAKRDTVDN
ncbi:MAG: hypothetical protein VB080_08275 [Propionicimonas sp.]|uniref:hypothetical protein n=1 Tax=Propionicimonas sp. TaxID=1955623 RepID=UPI002B2159D6|nr:hypothetical protein [Propionicimonas sp.]MEA4944420.1 hypothetical protein [Propionicimonas sp.]MEA5051999.1 hypothetical protein [Propionicimonas sp.]MEA5117937.1 hypothetical protein [Propionicimonas sp.]